MRYCAIGKKEAMAAVKQNGDALRFVLDRQTFIQTAKKNKIEIDIEETDSE